MRNGSKLYCKSTLIEYRNLLRLVTNIRAFPPAHVCPLDRISELITISHSQEEVKNEAQNQTERVLSMLDSSRKGIVLQSLYRLKLTNLIDWSKANLGGADLLQAHIQ